jgi:dTDP-4-dehydrorhamnose 3,5-epimerase
MRVTSSDLPEVLVIEPQVFGDSRGYFLESWSQARYQKAGLTETFVQDNLSLSRRGTLRGLHFQEPKAQGKLVSVLEGTIFDVVVDIRVGSPRFGKSMSMMLSGETKHQLYIPPGFAHGFCVLSDTALFMYKCTEAYAPEAEVGVGPSKIQRCRPKTRSSAVCVTSTRSGFPCIKNTRRTARVVGADDR